jgi:hypothetical protein
MDGVVLSFRDLNAAEQNATTGFAISSSSVASQSIVSTASVASIASQSSISTISVASVFTASLASLVIPPPTASPSQSSSSASHSNIGLIAGTIAAAVSVLLFLGLAGAFCYKRQKKLVANVETAGKVGDTHIRETFFTSLADVSRNPPRINSTGAGGEPLYMNMITPYPSAARFYYMCSLLTWIYV